MGQHSFAADRARASRRLPAFLFDYVDGGSGDEVTLTANSATLAGIALKRRVLGGTGIAATATTLLGRPAAMPLALAPIGFGGMMDARGEVLAARAAAAAGVPFTLSTLGICDIEEVARAAAPFWFQLYVFRDRGYVRALIARAQAAGCSTLVFTVDLPIHGARRRDLRWNGPGLAVRLRRLAAVAARPGWAWRVGLHGRPHSFGNLVGAVGKGRAFGDFANWIAANLDPAIGWDDIAAIRACWTGPIVIKGILDVEDARRAADLGVDAIIVSNHGGRQLDGAPASAHALPAIADAVGDRIAILADSGVRTGADIVRMLALGARGVLIGRPWVYALAAGGEAGVAAMLARFAHELTTTMTLIGAKDIAAIDRSVLAG